MEDKGLHNLSPAPGATRDRKRVGRGPGSGTGKRSGRGQKGQKARSGSHNMRAGFEGGQMPVYMRIGKLRGSTHKMSMPMGPFRTFTQPVNVDALSVFEAGTRVTPELLRERGILRNLKHPVKILGNGDLSVKLTVVASKFSKSAVAKIEAAGGTVELIPGPKPNGKGLELLRKAEARAAATQGATSSSAAAAAAGGAETDTE
jgi:large subunit ribosomal protein L15